MLTYSAPIRRQGKTLGVATVDISIQGLSAALEAARGGARVVVLEMFSVFGGVGVMSHGGICLIDSPVQRAAGIEDSPELAYKDFVELGEDPNVEWARYYVNNSIAEIHDWLVEMGVVFEFVTQPPGNSVPRFHNPRGRELGLVGPIYRECVKHPNVEFVWNTKADDPIVEDGRVAGVRAGSTRTGEERDGDLR
jgi:predicted oxidoreductase